MSSQSTPAVRHIRIVCVSDTHNDDLSGYVPHGDVFIHAGDMSDDGTPEELEKALAWIRKLPHPLKVVIAGNHDVGLDPHHKGYNPATYALFTSTDTRADGVVYLDHSQPTLSHDGLLSIYANPSQPDFLNSDYAFTYLPYPSPQATAAWTSAPEKRQGQVDLWVSHGAPKGRLDKIGIPGLMGCEAQRRKVAAARPMVCVFGHYHVSYGVEKVEWDHGDGDGDDGIKMSEMLVDEKGDGVYDLSGLKAGKETVFVNAAWMTGEKRASPKRNLPVVIELQCN